jgi:mannosyltransferase OCH1-like enzyme
MIPKIVHQIYDNNYKDEVDQTELFCLTNNIEYKMWSKKDIELLIINKYPEFIDLYNICNDFIKYIILYEYGGIFINCDFVFVDNIIPYDIFDREYFFVKSNEGAIYNAIIGSKKYNNVLKIILCQKY